jgi:hypothetical protein
MHGCKYFILIFVQLIFPKMVTNSIVTDVFNLPNVLQSHSVRMAQLVPSLTPKKRVLLKEFGFIQACLGPDRKGCHQYLMPAGQAFL